MTDETRARFLAAIAAQLPVERIAEVHLFPAIRQGGMESGVAVIAVELRDAATDASALAHAAAPEVLPDDVVDFRAEPTSKSHEVDAVEVGAEEDLAEVVEDVLADDAQCVTEVEPEPPAAPAPRRYTVFSARYRHTLKGPERGKWETSVTEEADAPLLTVDLVVRGVQRRSGDVDEIVRLSGDEVRAKLPVPATT